MRLQVLLLTLGISAGTLAAQARFASAPPRYRDRFDGRDRLVSTEVGAAIQRGLGWLRAHQNEDGHWDPERFMLLEDPTSGARSDGAGEPHYALALTGLAVLALLGDGVHESESQHARAISKGVVWLLAQQKPSGLFGSTAAPEYIYGHAIATLAMVEAAGLLEEARFRTAAQKALGYLEVHRNGKPAWAYEPAEGQPDVSVTSWCATAYTAALEFGFDVNIDVLGGVLQFFDRLTGSGRVGYSTSPGGGPARLSVDHGERFPRRLSEGPTAAALMTRFWLGQSVRDKVVRDNAGIVYNVRPSLQPNGRDFYYWYYATYGMFQYGGQGWRNWRKELEPVMLALQSDEGHAAGSWNPDCCWGEVGGRVYSTAIAVLTLEAPYRLARFSAIPGVPDDLTFHTCYAAWSERKFATVKDELERLDKASLGERDRVLLTRGKSAFDAASGSIGREIDRLSRGGDDILAAQRRLEEISDEWAGLDAGKRAAKILKSFKTDRSLLRQIRASKKLSKALARFAKTTDVLRYRMDLKAVVRSFGRTIAANRAGELLRELK